MELVYLKPDELNSMRVRSGTEYPKTINIDYYSQRDHSDDHNLGARAALEFGCAIQIFAVRSEPPQDGLTTEQRYEAAKQLTRT